MLNLKVIDKEYTCERAAKGIDFIKIYNVEHEDISIGTGEIEKIKTPDVYFGGVTDFSFFTLTDDKGKAVEFEIETIPPSTEELRQEVESLKETVSRYEEILDEMLPPDQPEEEAVDETA